MIRGDDETLGHIRQAVTEILAAHDVPVGDGVRPLRIFTVPRSSTRLRVLMDLEWATGRVLGAARVAGVRSAGDLIRALGHSPKFRRDW